METKIKGGCGFVDKYQYPRNHEIKSELVSLGKNDATASGIVRRLQYIRHNQGFFASDFKFNFKAKLAYSKECLRMLKENKLPLNTGGLRDQCIILLVGPFFMFQRKQRSLKSNGKAVLPDLEITRDDIYELMEGFEIQKQFVKELYWFHDADMEGEFFEMILNNFAKSKELPKFMTS